MKSELNKSYRAPFLITCMTFNGMHAYAEWMKKKLMSPESVDNPNLTGQRYISITDRIEKFIKRVNAHRELSKNSLREPLFIFYETWLPLELRYLCRDFNNIFTFDDPWGEDGILLHPHYITAIAPLHKTIYRRYLSGHDRMSYNVGNLSSLAYKIEEDESYTKGPHSQYIKVPKEMEYLFGEDGKFDPSYIGGEDDYNVWLCREFFDRYFPISEVFGQVSDDPNFKRKVRAWKSLRKLNFILRLEYDVMRAENNVLYRKYREEANEINNILCDGDEKIVYIAPRFYRARVIRRVGKTTFRVAACDQNAGGGYYEQGVIRRRSGQRGDCVRVLKARTYIEPYETVEVCNIINNHQLMIYLGKMETRPPAFPLASGQ